ncbi:MAG: 4-demethylwyosine synthase TYW1 [Promethearchaeota archaeon]|nr:MAG: 4-demethylwyosine synthase TYW1 [Candidatus Lokiarchaeota archaeon]
MKTLKTLLPKELQELLKKQKYQLVGRHSAVKACRWMRKALKGEGVCYKQKFYGIQSHRCLQMTPTVGFCTNHCLHCWRVEPDDIAVNWDELLIEKIEDPDSPEEIVEGSLKAQKRILSGYKPTSHQKVSWEKWNEALEPTQVAISLSGEPTLYPFLNELIELFNERKMTTFLVSNGTRPKTIQNISEPTMLYISIYGPDKSTYFRVARPIEGKNWTHLNETLEILNSYSSNTVLRLTLVNNLNLKNPEGYAKLIAKADPTFVEAKAYMFVGASRSRLTFEHMPEFPQIQTFAEQLAEQTGYHILDESKESRVVLLSKLSKKINLNKN